MYTSHHEGCQQEKKYLLQDVFLTPLTRWHGVFVPQSKGGPGKEEGGKASTSSRRRFVVVVVIGPVMVVESYCHRISARVSCFFFGGGEG